MKLRFTSTKVRLISVASSIVTISLIFLMPKLHFVPAWKASSVVLTGCFGVLGLLKDFRDKNTGRVTRWGKFALVGILSSTLFGFIAQVMEESEADRTRESTASQTLAMVKNTDSAVRDVQRLLSPISSPSLRFVWNIDCDNKTFEKFCLAQKDNLRLAQGSPVLSSFHQVPEDFVLPMMICIFSEAQDADKFVALDDLNFTLGADLSFRVMGVIKNFDKDPHSGVFRVFSSDGNLHLTMDASPTTFRSSGRIASTRDLGGSVVVISDWSNNLRYLQLSSFSLRTSDGRETGLLGPCSTRVSSNFTYYMCRFPETAAYQGIFGSRDPRE